MQCVLSAAKSLNNALWGYEVNGDFVEQLIRVKRL